MVDDLVLFALRSIGVRLGSSWVLRGLDWELNQGQCAVIVGPSGSGKSVLLNVLLGFVKPSEGSVNRGRPLDHDFYNSVGVTFQDDALLEECTVGDNLLIALTGDLASRCAGASTHSLERVTHILSEVQLEPRRVMPLMPSRLSGGMRRRVALARALIREPRVIIADEPTTGLDARTSQQICSLLADLIERRKMSAVIVTHDPVCALTLGRPLYYFRPTGTMPCWTPSAEELGSTNAEEALERWLGQMRSAFIPLLSAQPHTGSESEASGASIEPSTDIASMMAQWLSQAGHCAVQTVDALGRAGMLLAQACRPLPPVAFASHLLRWGVGAMPLVSLIFFLFGIVAHVQAEQAVVDYGFSNELPQLVALALLRIAPLLSGLLLAGRSGSALAAWVGGMQWGGQLRALRTMRIDPDRQLFAPLLWALALAAPVLALFSVGVGVVGALVTLASPFSHAKITVDFFLEAFPAYVGPIEIFALLLKGVLMGGALALTLYQQATRPMSSPVDISRAITRALVVAFVAMAVIDSVLSLLLL